MHPQRWFVLLIWAHCSFYLFAETQDFSPVNSASGLSSEQLQNLNRTELGTPGLTNGNTYYGTSSNGIAGGVLNRSMQDASGIQYDLQTNYDGRENKAKRGKNSSNAGVAAHSVTGALLTAAGTRLIAMPSIPAKVAGAELLAKAAQEFAQAAADAGTAGANGAQESLLKSNANQNGQQMIQDAMARSQNDATLNSKNRIDTPEVRDVLTSQGVNSDEFLDRLSRGAFNGQEDILHGLGIKDSISDADRLQADQLAGSAFNDTLKGLTFNESKNDLNAPSSGASVSSNVPTNFSSRLLNGSAGNVLPATSSGDSQSIANNNVATRKVKSESEGKAESNAAESSSLPTGDWAKSMLGQLGPGGEMHLDSLAGLNTFQLESLGIAKMVKGQNIFQRMHRTYRRFWDWRKESDTRI